MTDKRYAMSSFLQLRTVHNKGKRFSDKLDYPKTYGTDYDRIPVGNSTELIEALREKTEDGAQDGKMAIAISGGIDGAILARFLPMGSHAYTFKCVVPGREVIDETADAKKYCDSNGLVHHVVEVYWEDYEQYAPLLMKNKRAPIHSIEVQIYKAALQAKRDGFDKLLFGETADIIYGGFSMLLSRDYTCGEFVERYSHVMPYKALKDCEVITEPFAKHCTNGYVDVHGFMNDVFYKESLDSYKNACETAGIEFVAPYSLTIHEALDIERVRKGENKYLVREVFSALYPGLAIPEKIPMPRPVTEWLENWEGPKRAEFWENCHVNMTGDQKYYVWILEQFLNMADNS